jgi:hypothetical protein
VVLNSVMVLLLVSLHVYPPSRRPRIGVRVCQGPPAGVGRLCDVRPDVTI